MSETTTSPAGTTDAPSGQSARSGGLSSKLLPELKQIAGGLGIKGVSSMKKAQLVDAIRAAQSGQARQSGQAEQAGPSGQTEQAGPSGRTEQAGPSGREGRSAPERNGVEEPRRDSAAGGPTPDGGQRAEAESVDSGRQGTVNGQGSTGQPLVDDRAVASSERRDEQQRRDDSQSGPRNGSTNEGGERGQGHGRQQERQDRDSGRNQRNQDRQQQGAGQDRQDRQDRQGRQDRQQGGNQQRQDGQDRQPQGQAGQNQDDDDLAGGNRRRRRRGRERQSGGQTNQAFRDRRQPQDPDVEVTEDDVLVPVAGIVDILDNYAFVRTSGYLPGPDDVYVSLSMVRRYGLRKGDAVTGAVRQAREGERKEKFNPLVRLETVNGGDVEAAKDRVDFNKLTPLYSSERLRLETDSGNLIGRVIDIAAPIGKGQRGLIVSPPKAGKTMVLQSIANSITTNNP